MKNFTQLFLFVALLISSAYCDMELGGNIDIHFNKIETNLYDYADDRANFGAGLIYKIGKNKSYFVTGYLFNKVPVSLHYESSGWSGTKKNFTISMSHSSIPIMYQFLPLHNKVASPLFEFGAECRIVHDVKVDGTASGNSSDGFYNETVKDSSIKSDFKSFLMIPEFSLGVRFYTRNSVNIEVAFTYLGVGKKQSLFKNGLSDDAVISQMTSSSDDPELAIKMPSIRLRILGRIRKRNIDNEG